MEVHLLIVALAGLVVAVVVLLGIVVALIRANGRMGIAFIDLENRHRECRHALVRRESRSSKPEGSANEHDD